MSLAVFALIGTPLLAFLGVLVGHWATRRNALELDRWRTREETMRLLRWGTEIALDADPARSSVGLDVLGALLRASLLDEDDRALVATVLDAVAASRRGTLGPQEGRPP